MADAYDNLLIERHADGYAVVTLNRPEALNALNSALFKDLSDFLDAVEHDDSVRCLILTGSGDKAFAAGADIKEMADQSYADMYKANFFSLGHDRITRFRKPIIAAVNGFALGGGCELAMLCDFIVASEKAKFGQPEINLGIIPGAGGTQRLARLVGPARAKDIIFSGRMVGADEALAIGLADRVVEPDKVYAEAVSLVAQYVNGPGQALRAAKLAIDGGLDRDLAAGLAWESQLFAGLFATEDKAEGMTAFVEKRKPSFQNR